MYMYSRNFKFHIKPMNINNIGEEHEACRPLLKMEGSASAWPASHFRPLSAAQKVCSLAPAYSSIPPHHNQYDHGVLAASIVST